jgi:hypothetical protein
MMRRSVGFIAAALLCLSACSSDTGRAPTAPSTGIAVAPPDAAAGASGAVSWSCFTARGGGAFGAGSCVGRVTVARVLPAVAALTAPGAPTNLTATVNGSTVTLNWTGPVGGYAPTSFLGQAVSAAGLTDIASFDTGSTATALAVLNWPAGTYFVRVRAVNSAGTSGPSNEFQLVVAGAAPCGSLSAPSGVSAAVTGTTVALSWTAPSGCAPTSYIIQAGSAPGLSDLANFSTGSTATSFTATNVPSGTYYVRILSAASGGVVSAPSTEITFVVGTCGTAPNAPTNLFGTASGATVTLTWDAPATGCPATSFLLQAGSTPGASNVANSVVNGTGLVAAGVAPGTYYIRVIAVNAVGQSPASPEIVVTVGTTTLIASFQLFDPDTQGAATTECRIRSSATPPRASTCVLRSTSFTLGSNTIVNYAWDVQYTYDTVKTISVSGSNPTLSFSDTCGQASSTSDGVAQPLTVTLTVTDNLGATATVRSGSGSQPPLFIRLFSCGT